MSSDKYNIDTVFIKERPVLIRTVARIVGSMSVAEELIHDAYLKVVSATSAQNIENIAPFLYQTARHLALDHLRTAKRRGAIVVPEAAVEDVASIAAISPDPEAVARNRQAIRRLEGILARLSARQQRILVLARLEGVTLVEIAERLGVSLSTVQKDLKTAMVACMNANERLDWP